MKLISLNLWGGRAGKEDLLDFLKRHEDVDIFCFQEMLDRGHELVGKVVGDTSFEKIVPDLYKEIGNLLKGHHSYFRPHYRSFYGLAIFIKKDLPVMKEGEFFVYKEPGYASPEKVGDHARNMEYIQFESPKERTVINFHGLWNGQGKSDTEDRLQQSEKTLAFLKNIHHPYILCGDFNLLPETESIKKLERQGLRNLIKEFDITSTRTSFYKKPIRFADYIFVSKGITVKDFKILPEEVSDHAAMYLDFE